MKESRRSVANASRAEPLLLGAGKAQRGLRCAKGVRRSKRLRGCGKRAHRAGRSRARRDPRRAKEICRTRVLRRARQRSEAIGGADPSGRAKWRRLALTVGNARAARGLLRARVARARHLAHPVSRRRRTRAGAVERPRRGSRIGRRKSRDRHDDWCDRRGHGCGQLRRRAWRQWRHHQWVRCGELRPSNSDPECENQRWREQSQTTHRDDRAMRPLIGPGISKILHASTIVG
jgi:hypothetical protein